MSADWASLAVLAAVVLSLLRAIRVEANLADRSGAVRGEGTGPAPAPTPGPSEHGPQPSPDRR